MLEAYHLWLVFLFKQLYLVPDVMLEILDDILIYL
jgi:hypothetical protein